MKLEIKVLTPQFMEKVTKYIESRTVGMSPVSAYLNGNKERQYLNLYWNGKMILTMPEIAGMSNIEFQEKLKKQLGDVAVPEYVDLVVEERTPVTARQTHIMWNGVITETKQIPEIISVTPVSYNRKLSGVDRRLSINEL